jgi:hypothetical protein
MAQNNWINITLSPAASKQPDRSDHVNAPARGASASGDLTISFDSSKVTSVTLLKSAVFTALEIAMQQMPK